MCVKVIVFLLKIKMKIYNIGIKRLIKKLLISNIPVIFKFIKALLEHKNIIAKASL